MPRLLSALVLCSLFCGPLAFISEERAFRIVENVKKMAALSGGYDNNEYGGQKLQGDQPTVQTTSGLISGIDTETDHSFYSIPYAQPPVGDLRFKPPQPLNTSEMIRNLSVPTRIRCPQFHSNCSDGSCISVSEDCLVLNVHVPQAVDLSDPDGLSDRLPVMVWFHGGAFFFGAGTAKMYDGRFLSNVTNVIVVTVNYRLGPFGFLVLGEGEGALNGNQGLKDQQQALQWVQDNIENFGGDKDRVTIFGQSAGAQSVMFHFLSDVSEPLFHRGIMESNPAVYPYPDRTGALNVTNRLLRVLKLSSACQPRQTDRKCLYGASMDDLISATAVMMVRSAVQLSLANAVEPFRPFIDGEEYKGQPLKLFEEGRWQKQKPFIIGTASEELDVLKFFNPLELTIGETGFRAVNRLLFGNEIGQLVTDEYEELAAKINVTDYGLLFGKMATDLVFGCPSRALARYASATAEKQSVYLYVFSHWLDGADCKEHMAQISSDLCGYSYHSSELFFVFRVIEHMGLIPDEQDIIVSDQFSTYWGSFARTGSPSKGLEIPLPGNHPDWPPYVKGPQKRRKNLDKRMNPNRIMKNPKEEAQEWPNMRIDEPTSFIEYDFDQDICEFWDGLGVYTDPGPSTSPPVLTTTKIPQTTLNVVETTTGGARILSPGLLILYFPLAANLAVRD